MSEVQINDDGDVIPLPTPFASTFPSPPLERLYQTYSRCQKWKAQHVYIKSSMIFNVYVIVTSLITSNVAELQILLATFFLLLNVLIAIGMHINSVKKKFRFYIPIATWLLVNAQFCAKILVQKRHFVTTDECLGWLILFCYLQYVALPLHLRLCVIFSGITSVLHHVCIFAAVLMYGPMEGFYMHVLANCWLQLGANLIGICSYILADNQQRTAFLETRQSLKIKLAIDEQSNDQERLLLSVLPEHIAVNMRADLGAAINSQFKQIYMSRHENVSILYADIVGFTAISSTYSAPDLVRILNELFARFDKLAERYQQMRIKILGDCYYCISGAPQEREDHAILSVRMGLAMVQAIKYVQRTTNSPVDMRVGIHTGAILGGVLGQKQWQFDIYSKDVELANKMESSGLPGRVHISDKVYKHLNNEFEVEPAYGEKREESLRAAGLKTYFIVKSTNSSEEDITDADILNGEPNNNVLPEKPKIKEERAVTIQVDGAAIFRQKLKRELMTRHDFKDIGGQTEFFSMVFKDKEKEQEYAIYDERFSNLSFLGCLITLSCVIDAQMFVFPFFSVSVMDCLIMFLYSLISAFIACLAVVSIAEYFPNVFGDNVLWFSSSFNNSMKIRISVTYLLIIPTFGSINFPQVKCLHEEFLKEEGYYGSYFTHFNVLMMLAIATVSTLSHIKKGICILLVAAAQTGINMSFMKTKLDSQSLQTDNFPASMTLSPAIILIGFCLLFYCRYIEKTKRILFLWKMEVESQREKASDVARKNELLVYNLLPKHVAEHFLDKQQRAHDELYCQNFSEVGVLFASMPNFADFYTEELVNNQGLECLRFLNEVISDYDAILDSPQFQDHVIKIKTIGSTYMAASGLNPAFAAQPDDPPEIRWGHLILLVEFALEMKKALNNINSESFNHFVLKMGINVGSVVAGVIGARKPHYDIWGNSVNVASRMESTGRAGCIQVTEETCAILQQFGYKFEQRGLVAVKGKGHLMTYYLVGKNGPHPLPPPIMGTLPEEDEEDDGSANKLEEEKLALLNSPY